MAVLASDNFNRANDDDIGTNWTTTGNGYQLVSNAAEPADPDLGDSTSYYNAISWPNDQYSQVVCNTTSTNGSAQGIGVIIRKAAGATATRYRVIIDDAASNNVELAVFNPTHTTLWTRTHAFTTGDTLYAEVQGTTIIVKVNGTAVGASTTNSAVSSGNAGIDTSSAVTGTPTLDNFEGGSPAIPQLVRPDGDITIGSWTTDTGSTHALFQAIDETSASDSDYIQSEQGPSSSVVEVALGHSNDPSSSTDHAVRVRGSINAVAGGTMSLDTELRQGAAALSTPAVFTDSLTTTPTTFEHSLSGAQADAITDYGSLRLRFTATQAAPSAPTIVAAGTPAFTATNGATIAPGLPAGFAADDIHIMLAMRADNTAMTTLSGWNQITAISGNNTAAMRVEIWWRRAVGGDGAPTVTFGSGTVVRGARIIGVRGCLTSGDPFDTGGGAPTRSDNGAAATVTFNDLTTQGANRFLLALGAYEDDPTTATTMTGWTQPASAVSTSALGTDMTLLYQHDTIAAAGSSATEAITMSGGTFANSVNVGIVIAFPPASNASRARVTWAEFQVAESAVIQDVPETRGRGSLVTERGIRQLLAF